MPKISNKTITDYIYNSAYQIAAIIIPIITTPYISRTLGAGGIGQYGYEAAIAYYFMLIIKMGLNNYGNRTIAYYRDNKKELSEVFSNVYSMQLISLFIFLGIYYLYACFFSKNRLISLILSIYVISAGIDITWLFWGLEKFKTTVIRDFFIKFLSTISIFIFVHNENDTWKYTLILSLSAFFSQLLLWVSVKKYLFFVPPKLSEIKKHIKPNMILFIPVVAVSLYKYMDKVMLGSMTDLRQVGYYESSEKIIQIPTALVNSLGTIMLPKMSNLYSHGSGIEKTNGILEKSIIFAVFVSSSVGFGVMTIANEFVPLFYGSGFDVCIKIYAFLLPSCVFMAFANVLRTQVLIPQKRDKIYIISVFVGAFVNLIANYFLITNYYAVGAAIGTLLAEFSVCVIQAYALRSEIDVNTLTKKASVFFVVGLLMYILFHNVSFSMSNKVMIILLKVITAGSFYLIGVGVIYYFAFIRGNKRKEQSKAERN